MRPKILLLRVLVIAAFVAGVLWPQLPLDGGAATAHESPSACRASLYNEYLRSDLTPAATLQPLPYVDKTPPEGFDRCAPQPSRHYEVTSASCSKRGCRGPGPLCCLHVEGGWRGRAGAAVTRPFDYKFQTTCYIWHVSTLSPIR
jgi:hypothetical protein